MSDEKQKEEEKIEFIPEDENNEESMNMKKQFLTKILELRILLKLKVIIFRGMKVVVMEICYIHQV